MSGNKLSNIHTIGFSEVIVFLTALIAETILTSSSKIILEIQGSATAVVTKNDNASTTTTTFDKPLTVTFVYFIGMSLSLVLHWIVLIFHIPFPGYEFNDAIDKVDDCANMVGGSDQEKNTLEQATLLTELSSTCDNDDGVSTSMPAKSNRNGPTFIIAALDVADFVLWLMGLKYLDVSICQMLRGSSMIFLALMKQFIWKEYLYKFHWIGVSSVVISVIMFSSAALLSSREEESSISDKPTTFQFFGGVFLILTSSFLFSVQSLLIEKCTENVPALLLTGMVGFWGSVLSIFILLPIGYYVPGDDNGSSEDPFHSWSMIVTSVNIQVTLVVIGLSAFVYNIFVNIMVCMLGSVWNAILESFCTIAVWIVDLVIFYGINPSFGGSLTRYSYLQLSGLAALLFGTAIYNAPNDCSILLEGQWWVLGIDLSEEYDDIRKEQEVDHLEYVRLSDEHER